MTQQYRHQFVSVFLFKSLITFTSLFFALNTYANSLINNDSSQFIFNLDNDILFGTDREYTAGSHLYWTEPKLKPSEWLFDPAFDQLRSNFANKTGQLDQFLLATEIYTLRADVNSKVEPLANTGWTYFGFRHIEAYASQQLGMELNLGWIGPKSGGEEIQNGVHKLIGNKDESGWNHQYPNQATINLNVSLQNDISSLSNDSFRSFYTLSGQLGSLRTNLSGGLGLSYANNCAPTFFDNQLNTIHFHSGWGWFAYSTLNVDYEIYNRLTDGRILTDDRPLINRRYFWPLLDMGIGFTYNGFSINYSTKTTPQYYDDQPERRFRYSSLNFHWRF